MSEEGEERALQPSKALYGTGVAGSFADSLSNRYISLLAVAVGVTVSQMSWLRAAESLSRHIFQFVWGRLVDRHGKRRFILAGRVLNGALIAALIFIRAPGWLIPLVVGIAICWSLASPAWSSLMGDYTTSSTRGEVIGQISSLSQAGGVAAMVISLLISLNQPEETTPESFTIILAMAAVMSIASGLLSIFAEEKPPAPSGERLDLSKLMGDKRYVRYLAINMVYGLSMSFAWPLFPFIVVDKLGMKIWQIAAYSICSAVFAMISQRRLGRLMDRIGRRPVVVFSRLSMVAAPLVYALAGDWTHILVAEAMLGVGMGAWMSSGPTYIMDMAPLEMRATYIAANTAVFGVSSFIGNLAGGYVTDNFLAAGGGFAGIQMGLLISSILRLITGLLYILIYETHSVRDRGVEAETKEL